MRVTHWAGMSATPEMTAARDANGRTACSNDGAETAVGGKVILGELPDSLICN